MIYDSVPEYELIRQGDIFRDIPRIDYSLLEMMVVDSLNEPARLLTWMELLEEQVPDIQAILHIKKVTGIVITQDCDAARGDFLSLCQIQPYRGCFGSIPSSPEKWQSQIRKRSRDSLRFFYLPADKSLGFGEKMAVDFRLVLPIKRPELESMRNLRIGRLNKVAYEHFRETLAQFFRRYPYNEWYPFTREEFQAYRESIEEEVSPYPWQE